MALGQKGLWLPTLLKHKQGLQDSDIVTFVEQEYQKHSEDKASLWHGIPIQGFQWKNSPTLWRKTRAFKGREGKGSWPGCRKHEASLYVPKELQRAALDIM